jgi:hypothetical protein
MTIEIVKDKKKVTLYRYHLNNVEVWMPMSSAQILHFNHELNLRCLE